ncbi:MAG TPA: flagellar hook-length control protein FliK [Gallionella sp.]|nr:flagellar hook-length control protein FliK [Gallionella sp.]
MLPTNLINALQVLSHSGKPPVGTATDAPKPVAPLEPGQELQGSVQSKVSEGLFKVQVAGQTIQMRLPANIQSGDTLNLRVVSTNPRLTFSISASLNPLSSSEQIGAAARMLSNLADRPLERPTIQQIARNVVWQTAGQVPDSRQLAGALRQALSVSGLFYESHQAQWVRGERSTMQLLVEPQNQLAGKQSSPPGAGQTSQTSQSDDVYASSPASTAPQKTDTESGLRITRELLPLVQQQLHALETHQITWIGQVWPGQEMQWEIQGQPDQHAPQPDERQWSTEMELALPGLGNIHARLAFAGSGLRLTLQAADATTVDLFTRALPQLKNSLADAQIPLLAAVVEKL